MPQLDSRFVLLPPVQEVIFNKDDGTLLAAGVVYFYSDPAFTVPKPVYQLSLSPSNQWIYTELNNPITLTSIGSFSDDNGNDIVPYLFPYEGSPDDSTGEIELYYIAVYSEGGIADGVLQFTREAWPNTAPDSNPISDFEPSDNQLANPQFVEVLFTPDLSTAEHVYTVSGTNTVTPVAPGWDFVTTGSGTITVSQVGVVDVDALTNPPYALDIQGGGSLSSLRLRQRLTASPRIFANGFISSTFVANSQDGVEHLLNLEYIPSDSPTGTTIALIEDFVVSASATFQVAEGTAEITGTINTDVAPDGYVDISLDIPPLAHIQVSSFQIVGVSNLASSTPFMQQSEARQIDHLFHYYKPALDYKPIPSYLVGWDFALNPAQFGGRTQAATAIGANKSKYVWDQTIVFQSANSGVGVTGGANGQLVLTAAATTQMAVIQYLGADEARHLLNAPLSVNVAAKTSAAGGVNATVSLWRTLDPSLPNITTGTNNSLVATLDADGKPAMFNGTWVEIPREDQGSAQFTIETNATTEFNDYAFSGWNMEGAATTATATFFAIVVGTAEVTAADTVSIESISLVPGLIPTRPAPQTSDEVLQECQYYYEQSYAAGVAAGTVTDVNAMSLPLQSMYPSGGGNAQVIALPFEISFNTIKRSVTPVITIYNPTALNTADSVRVVGWNRSTGSGNTTSAVDVTFSTNWNVISNGSKRVTYSPNVALPALTTVTSTGVGNASSAGMRFHNTIDARLGVV